MPFHGLCLGMWGGWSAAVTPREGASESHGRVWTEMSWQERVPLGKGEQWRTELESSLIDPYTPFHIQCGALPSLRLLLRFSHKGFEARKSGGSWLRWSNLKSIVNPCSFLNLYKLYFVKTNKQKRHTPKLTRHKVCTAQTQQPYIHILLD